MVFADRPWSVWYGVALAGVFYLSLAVLPAGRRWRDVAILGARGFFERDDLWRRARKHRPAHFHDGSRGRVVRCAIGSGAGYRICHAGGGWTCSSSIQSSAWCWRSGSVSFDFSSSPGSRPPSCWPSCCYSRMNWSRRCGMFRRVPTSETMSGPGNCRAVSAWQSGPSCTAWGYSGAFAETLSGSRLLIAGTALLLCWHGLDRGWPVCGPRRQPFGTAYAAAAGSNVAGTGRGADLWLFLRRSERGVPWDHAAAGPAGTPGTRTGAANEAVAADRRMDHRGDPSGVVATYHHQALAAHGMQSWAGEGGGGSAIAAVVLAGVRTGVVVDRCRARWACWLHSRSIRRWAGRCWDCWRTQPTFAVDEPI